MNDLQKEIRRLSNLKQNRKKDQITIEQMAQKNLWLKQTNISERFTDLKDQKLAEKIFENYLSNYTFESYTDVQNVADLVFEEITKLKIQQQISGINADKNTKFVPDRLIDSLHKIEDKIYVLKEKAGIVGTKEQDDLTAYEAAEKKFKTYIAFNRNEFTFWAPIVCEDCGSKKVKPVLIRRRCNKENFEILKHPFFSGRFYYNRRGIELVKSEIWTKEQYAWVFQTSVKYVNWCIENENKIVEIDDVEEKEIQDFINNCEYLKSEKIPDKILKDK